MSTSLPVKLWPTRAWGRPPRDPGGLPAGLCCRQQRPADVWPRCGTPATPYDLLGHDHGVSARMKGRRREVERLVADVRRWGADCVDIRAIAVVGSFARAAARPGSDLDLVLLCEQPDRLGPGTPRFRRWLPPASCIAARGVPPPSSACGDGLDCSSTLASLR